MLSENINLAAKRIAAGELQAFATETVYGLGADAANPAAVAKIFSLKGRPANHPLIVHIANSQDVSYWAQDVPDYAYALMTAFWPGPLTLILPKSANTPLAVTGGQTSVGLRCPSHPVAQALLVECLRLSVLGIAAPSANRFGQVSPTTAAHVADEFGADCPPVLDGGACEVGIESTIVDCTDEFPRVLRQGFISEAQIFEISGKLHVKQASKVIAPRASGTLPAHYAPRTPVRLGTLHDAIPSNWAWMGINTRSDLSKTSQIMMPNTAVAYAQTLYATLRELDNDLSAANHDKVRGVIIENPMSTEYALDNDDNPSLWAAITDRLSRAAAAHSD